MMKGYYETKAGYDFWKKQYIEDLNLGFNEQTDIGIHNTHMYNKYLKGLIEEISEVKYQLIDSGNDSFSKTIAVIDVIIALSQQDDDKLYFLSDTNKAIDVLLNCLNKIFVFIDRGLVYYQSKDYSNELIKDLIDKCGWEMVIDDLINLETSKILCVDYQTEEYQLLVYGDRFEAYNDLKYNIENIEVNTELFNDYNDIICNIINEHWDMIDFDYNEYYTEVV